MNPILAKLIGKKITGIRSLNAAEIRCEGSEAVDGLLIEVADAAIFVVNKTLDCDEYPSDERWTDVTLRTLDGDEVNLAAGAVAFPSN